ncbi:asparagine synthetase B [Bradyrhizobium macuxiense]|uniref:asparagine synthase (glutamine-hydrolyzing) n=1 Tax=Bradyrhizobium macuxiense TaxID=1755647 RepID=A0A109K2Y0_9BRAD|nr:asparagine synthase (glutamine-hydrolyzing) [Bradyrhizobium macuxiense]KWV59459.1 asparagine synthetase B [Bradyrhizobium macuxiense]
MCGIAGFLDRTIGAQLAVPLVRKMAQSIAHRGPDDEGAWNDAEPGIALAQRRLAIVDLSPAGHQPMFSANGRFVIVFNGEIYNHTAIRSELDKEAPRAWRGHSDTEVLIEAIGQWGIMGALKRCVGMFALALWDRQKRTLTLARDRIGEKPLYYGWFGNCFAFASELKAFRVLPRYSQEIDRGSLALLVRHGYVPAPYTIFRGVHKVRPAEILTFGEGVTQAHVQTYWSGAAAAQQGTRSPFTGTRSDAVDELERLLRQSLEGQMMADVPLGAFLSGGIDSSTIVALMQSMSSQPIRSFTIGFDVKGYNEAEHAKQVAVHLGTNHTELYVTERDALEVIPKLPTIYCEPFSDPSQIPTYLVSRLARQDVTVSLSGDAGDELFSGYVRYGLTERLWGSLSMVPFGLRRTARTLATRPSPAMYDRIVGPLLKVAPSKWRNAHVGEKIHKAADILTMRNIDEVYLRLCSQWPEPAQIVVDGREHPTMLTGMEALPEFAGPVERMMYLDTMSYLPDDILVKVDRAAMAVSLETRVPLLDHRIVEFALSLPIEISRADGETKWPLRQVLYRHVPKHLIERPKMGFGVPIAVWLRGALREWAEDLLSEDRLRREGYFRCGMVRKLWQEHLSGRRNHQYCLWNVLMFQAWLAEVTNA